MPSFRGELLDALRSRLGIEKRFSVPFHHESQGLLGSLCKAIPPSGISCFVCSIRAQRGETQPNGYSASEMVYNKKMRGLLTIMRDTWTGRDPMVEWKNMSTVEYMEQLNREHT